MKKLFTLVFISLLFGCSNQQLAVEDKPVYYKTSPSTDEVSISAMSLIGTPYIWGGNTPQSGFDCSGLIVYVYNSSGVKLPRTTQAMSHMATPSVKRNSLQTGDLVFFSTSGRGRVSHAGIYVGNGRFVHAPSSGGVVKLSDLNEGYWRKSFVMGKRIIH